MFSVAVRLSWWDNAVAVEARSDESFLDGRYSALCNSEHEETRSWMATPDYKVFVSVRPRELFTM